MNQELYDQVTGYKSPEFGELTPANIARLTALCLLLPRDKEAIALGEDIPIVTVDAVTRLFDFRLDRLKEHEPEIRAMLDRVDPKFKESGGHGAWYGFFNLTTYPDSYESAHEVPAWAPPGHAEWLLALGLAIGKVRWLSPRETWKDLPNGLPYLVVLAEPGETVAPLEPLEDPAPPVIHNHIVPWILNSPKKVFGAARRLVRRKKIIT